MSDAIKHECGVALIRLLKPLDFYKEKYGTPLYGLNKLYLLMEKQHNRGQDGAGVGVVKLGLSTRAHFMNRQRSNSPQAISEIFQQIGSKISELKKLNPELFDNTEWLKKNAQFVGELLMGHLRYGTHGKNELDSCHPFIINDQSALRSLQMCGNFNLTNIDELGYYDEENSERPDTAVVLERISAHLEKEIDRVFTELKNTDGTRNELNQKIGERVSFHNILKNATAEFDGGYNMVGMSGTGVAFVLRDARGIRPSFYYVNDEVVVAASERTAIQTTFNVPVGEIKELTPGCALIIDQNGKVGEYECQPQQKKTSCSFERIYFSRGSDTDIYNERKNLGNYLTPQVVEAINHDFKNTVFSFIPNTAEVAFYGLIKGGEDVLNEWKMKAIREPEAMSSDERVQEILRRRLRIEKIAIKDVKMRTFITQDSERNEMVEHVYDITYGSIRPNIDSIVVIDDSIVRGTTLKRSIIKMLDRLQPKKIVIVSSAPQIRYPDCYGIDMSKMGEFIAFRAAVALLKERGMENKLDEVYDLCKLENEKPVEQITNKVKLIYEPFTAEEVAAKIAELVKDESVNAEVEVIFQKIENLHRACPNHTGSWYFNGNYPTHGGNRVVNRSFINYMEGKSVRAY